MSDTVKILVKDTSNSPAQRIAFLITLNIWDTLPLADRRAWCDRGEIMDTPGGRLLVELFRKLGAF